LELNWWVTLGRTPVQPDLWRWTANFCEDRVDPDSIYGVLYRECFHLFPDEMFADLFTDVGRRSVPPLIVAVVMVLSASRTHPHTTWPWPTRSAGKSRTPSTN